MATGAFDFGAMTGAAMPLRVRLLGTRESPLSAGVSPGVADGLSLGRSLTFASTDGAGMPMSVPLRESPPLPRFPSGRVLAVVRGGVLVVGPAACAGMLDDVAGRGGALAAFGGALDDGRGGPLAGRGGSLDGLAAAVSAGFG